jgi:hypothetical protein
VVWKVQEACNRKENVKLSLCLTKHYTINTYGGVDVQIHVFLALVEGERSALRPDALPPGRRDPIPIGYKAGWAPELVLTVRIENS